MAVGVITSQESVTQRLKVTGGQRLNGTLTVSGAKNSALVLMTASLLTSETVELINVPDLTDIQGMGDILGALGVQVERSDSRVSLTASQLTNVEPPYELVNSLRASFFSIGSLLGRMGHAKVPLLCGCRI